MIENIVICGAGPAGSSLALALCQQGVRPQQITLLDSRRLEGRLLLPGKVCGDAVAAHTLDQLAALGVGDFATTEGGAYRAGGVVITAPNGVTARGRFKRADMVMQRAEFDGWICAAARSAGVTVLDGWRVREVERKGTGWQVDCQSGPQRQRIHADLLVGADGATSLLARKLGVSERPGLSVAMRGYLTAEDALLNDSNLYLDFLNTASGYGWYFQMRGAYRVNVGIGTTTAALKKLDRGKAGETLRAMLDEYMTTLVSRGRVREGARLQGVAAWQIPMSGRIGRVTGDRALLLGDAAGLVSPLTGAGIENAVDSALLAADAIVAALRQPERAEAALGVYRRRLGQVVGRHLRRDAALRRLGDNRAAFGLFASLCTRFPALMQGLIYAFK